MNISYFTYLKYYVNIFIIAHVTFMNSPVYDGQRCDKIIEAYSILHDKFEELQKEEKNFMDIINVLEKGGVTVLRNSKVAAISEYRRDQLVFTLHRSLAKIRDYKKAWKEAKEEALCRVACKIGGNLALYVDSFL